MSWDQMKDIAVWALLILGALHAFLLGLRGALAIIAPMTKWSGDNKLLRWVTWLESGLAWLRDKLAGIVMAQTGKPPAGPKPGP